LNITAYEQLTNPERREMPLFFKSFGFCKISVSSGGFLRVAITTTRNTPNETITAIPISNHFQETIRSILAEYFGQKEKT